LRCHCRSSANLFAAGPDFSYDTFSVDLVHERVRYYNMTDRLPIRIRGLLIFAAALCLAAAPSFADVLGCHALSGKAATSHHDSSPVFALTSSPYGISYSEWSARWWQWAFSLPVNHSPLFGTADCSAGQTDHVWFLPGAVPGSAQIPKQTCTVPANTALFVGIINGEFSNLEGFGKTEGALRSWASFYGDLIDPNTLSATLDGNSIAGPPISAGPLTQFLVQSPLFFFGPLPNDNLITYFCLDQMEGCPAAPTGSIGYSVGAGIYLMLSPLSRGLHTLQFHAEIPGAVTVDTTYHLTVKP